jgi:hypothetical protein
MGSEEILVGLVIVLIILLLWVTMKKPSENCTTCGGAESNAALQEHFTGPAPMQMSYPQEMPHAPGCTCPRCSPEAQAAAEHLNHYADEMMNIHNSIENADVTMDASTDDQSFTDYIKGQAIDPQTVMNHKRFVEDRMSDTKQNITGRTYALGELESDDGVNWIGIRGRPQMIPPDYMGNPTQVADFRRSGFSSNQRVVWTPSS